MKTMETMKTMKTMETMEMMKTMETMETMKTMKTMEMMKTMSDNVSSHHHFVLGGFDDLGALRPLLFLPFFIMLVVSLAANSLLLYVIMSQRSLHSPMYLLIAAMACVDLGLPLLVVPNMLLNFLFDWRGISLIGCLVQMFCVHFLGALQSTLLLCMALDRYFAICTPLYYHSRASVPRLLCFVIPLVVRNALMVSLLVVLAGNLSFCLGNVMSHCFCEHMALVELACGDTAANSIVGLISVSLIAVVDFFFIITSYVVIFSSVMRSGTSGVKALHTCVTHIVVMAVTMSIVLTAFLSYRIRNRVPASVRIFFSVMYLLFPSCFNPIVYGVRTSEIRRHIVNTLTLHGCVAQLSF